MSEIEETAKSYLLPLILGDWQAISREAQEAIAAWVTLFTMVAEFAHPPTVGIADHERCQFMKTKSPIEGLKIAVGFYRGKEWQTNFHHWGGAVYNDAAIDAAVAQGYSLPINTQITTGVVGCLLMHAVSGTQVALYGAEHYYKSLGLRCIWPPQVNSITGPYRLLGDREANRISIMLRDVLVSEIIKCRGTFQG